MASEGERRTTGSRVVGAFTSNLLRRYFVGPGHPSKVRVWRWLRRLQGDKPFLVPYGTSAWIAVGERCLVQRSIFTTGEYEPEVADALLRCAEHDEVVWDVGANIGAVSVRVRLDGRVSQLVSVEPDSENRKLLELNLALNPGAQCHVLACALSDVPGNAAWQSAPEDNRGLSRLADPTEAEDNRREVRCETLDGLVFEKGLPAPTLMKLDVEGAELAVLRGGRRLLRERPPKAIIFEARCLPSGEIVDQSLPRLLSTLGYVSKVIRRPSQSIDEQENYLAELQPQSGITRTDLKG